MNYTVRGVDIGKVTLGENDGVRSVLQCIAMVLGTPKGSVPYYREFGLDMEILDKPMNLAQARARTLIREAVERWVPQCTVNSVSFTRDDFTGKMTPTVEVEITDES